MQTSVHFTSDSSYSNATVENDVSQNITIRVDAARNYALVECASREALFEFGRSLMEAALFGHGEIEFYPLVSDGKELVVNGVRVSETSARMFVHFPGTGRYDL